ncbi:MAG: hypothetical protein AAF543_02925, partial [Pseudomonadota bacterium]
MIHADLREGKEALECIEACSSLRHAPVLLVASDGQQAALCSTWSERIDDIIVLPINADQLTARINSLSRLASMTAECHRRQRALRDFGAGSPVDVAVSADIGGMSALIIGSVDDQLSGMLKALDGNMAISFAIDASDALLQLRRSPPDVIMIASDTSASDIEMMLHTLRSNLDWCDLPVLIIADIATLPRLAATTAFWGGGLEVLPPSTQPAVTRLRLQTLVRQCRLRRELRGTMVDGSSAPVLDAKTKLYDHSFFHHYV